MNAPILQSRRHPDPRLTALGLLTRRVHELCGASRKALALQIAGETQGPVLWLRLMQERGQLDPFAMLDWLDPGRLIFADIRRVPDLLWSMEEALRSGAAPLVVAEIPEPPLLTPVRRLQLAAEAAPEPGLGLLLTPGEGGAPGVESRWQMDPRPGPFALRRLRARLAPEARFDLTRRKGKIALQPSPGLSHQCRVAPDATARNASWPPEMLPEDAASSPSSS